MLLTKKKHAHLGSPITKVVHGDDLPPTGLIQVGEERADDGTPQVANMERLGDIGR